MDAIDSKTETADPLIRQASPFIGWLLRRGEWHAIAGSQSERGAKKELASRRDGRGEGIVLRRGQHPRDVLGDLPKPTRGLAGGVDRAPSPAPSYRRRA